MPLRSNAALFAKQAATIDSLSGGRLVLGLAVGGRPDDYEVSEIDFHTRGAAFDRQLEQMTELWASDDVGPSPANGVRPSLLIGGNADRAFERAAKYADGWTLGGGTPDNLAAGKAKIEQYWNAAGREGKPRSVVLFYFQGRRHRQAIPVELRAGASRRGHLLPRISRPVAGRAVG